jgi:hypothetical protein
VIVKGRQGNLQADILLRVGGVYAAGQGRWIKTLDIRYVMSRLMCSGAAELNMFAGPRDTITRVSAGC